MESFKRWKWSLYIAASVLTVAGIAALIRPNVFMNIMQILLGLTLITVGLCELGFAFGVKEYKNSNSFKLVQGLVSLAAGVVFLFKNEVPIVFLGVVLGLWAIISGALRLTLALRQRAAGHKAWHGSLVDALVKGVIGTFMMFNPFVGLAAWTMIIGIFLAISGIALFCWITYINRHLDFFDF